jgi:hypothetical protein
MIKVSNTPNHKMLVISAIVIALLSLMIMITGCSKTSYAGPMQDDSAPPAPMMIQPIDTNRIIRHLHESVIYVYPCDNGKRIIAEYYRERPWNKWKLSVYKRNCKRKPLNKN